MRERHPCRGACARSSADKSIGLRNRGSGVRIPPGVPDSQRQAAMHSLRLSLANPGGRNVENGMASGHGDCSSRDHRHSRARIHWPRKGLERGGVSASGTATANYRFPHRLFHKHWHRDHAQRGRPPPAHRGVLHLRWRHAMAPVVRGLYVSPRSERPKVQHRVGGSRQCPLPEGEFVGWSRAMGSNEWLGESPRGHCAGRDI